MTDVLLWGFLIIAGLANLAFLVGLAAGLLRLRITIEEVERE